MKKLLIVFLTLSATACSSGYKPKIYDWESYNEATADEVLNSEDYNRLDAIHDFQSKLDKLGTNQIPPGALLHLAFMCEQEGLSDEARALMEREKKLFPDSAHWVEFLLKNDKKAGRSK